jgi:hypothetical protein
VYLEWTGDDASSRAVSKFISACYCATKVSFTTGESNTYMLYYRHTFSSWSRVYWDSTAYSQRRTIVRPKSKNSHRETSTENTTSRTQHHDANFRTALIESLGICNVCTNINAFDSTLALPHCDALHLVHAR